MDNGFDIPCVGGSKYLEHWDGDTMGSGVKIPWIGGSNTIGRRFDIPWLGCSIYHGYGGSIYYG